MSKKAAFLDNLGRRSARRCCRPAEATAPAQPAPEVTCRPLATLRTASRPRRARELPDYARGDGELPVMTSTTAITSHRTHRAAPEALARPVAISLPADLGNILSLHALQFPRWPARRDAQSSQPLCSAGVRAILGLLLCAPSSERSSLCMLSGGSQRIVRGNSGKTSPVCGGLAERFLSPLGSQDQGAALGLDRTHRE